MAIASSTNLVNLKNLDPAQNQIGDEGAKALAESSTLAALSKGEQLMQIEAHTAPVLSLAYKPDGALLASGGADKELKIWDTKTLEQKNLVTGHPGNIAAIAWPEKKAELITASDDGALRLCNETSKSPGKTWAKAADLLHCLAATADGKLIYGGADNGRVYVWDQQGKITRILKPSKP